MMAHAQPWLSFRLHRCYNQHHVLESDEFEQ
jgi:hypothetical protein